MPQCISTHSALSSLSSSISLLSLALSPSLPLSLHISLLSSPLSFSSPLISWYHYQITRHVAESVLMSTGEDGSYLLRDSNTNLGEFTLSVRSAPHRG